MKPCSDYVVSGAYFNKWTNCFIFIFRYTSQTRKNYVDYFELGTPNLVHSLSIQSIHSRHVDLVTPANSIAEVKLTHPELFL